MKERIPVYSDPLAAEAAVRHLASLIGCCQCGRRMSDGQYRICQGAICMIGRPIPYALCGECTRAGMMRLAGN